MKNHVINAFVRWDDVDKFDQELTLHHYALKATSILWRKPIVDRARPELAFEWTIDDKSITDSAQQVQSFTLRHSVNGKQIAAIDLIVIGSYAYLTGLLVEKEARGQGLGGGWSKPASGTRQVSVPASVLRS